MISQVCWKYVVLEVWPTDEKLFISSRSEKIHALKH
jgi:hypothetical protein